MKLLLRPRPISGESWPGYLLRLAETNSFGGAAKLAKGLGKTVYGLFTSPPEEILSVLQIEPPVDAAQPLPVAFPWAPSLFSSGRPLNSKVCTMCLPVMDIPHLKADWDRAFAFECRKHRVLLTETCHACGCPLTYLREHVARCNCGFRLSHTRPRRPEAFLFGVLDLLQLGLDHINPSPTFGCSGRQDLAAQTFLQWLARLDAGLYGKKASARKLQAYVSLDEVRKIAHWFDEWPRSFVKRAFEVQIQAESRYSVKVMIFNHGKVDRWRFPRIVDALSENVLNGRTAPRPRMEVGLETATLNSAEFVSKRFVMRATGCSAHIVGQWLSKGWLGNVQIAHPRKGLMQYLITREAASKAIQLIRSTASAQEMAKAIGMKVGCLRDLIRYGVIRGLPYGQADWDKRVVPEEVFQLTARLLAAAKLAPQSKGAGILLEAAILRLSRPHSALVEPFIRAVLSCEIPTRLFDRHPTRLDQISLAVADFVCWRSAALRAT